ncbi:hypothetical protein Psch_03167 [Pelotomaculum schinkii]|uniref:Uncharacterized protein n=1 Tax=Pelotomaculum schinkii TaxID=78350 RepID=A0A4Y7RAV3_9FIRM|nr:hypothetical protein Psch_03167 [Pelotomaculum schinkii]TEB12887.1 hypothetical protein Psfp_03624 [Pelotomaculum sp. FP]
MTGIAIAIGLGFFIVATFIVKIAKRKSKTGPLE